MKQPTIRFQARGSRIQFDQRVRLDSGSSISNAKSPNSGTESASEPEMNIQTLAGDIGKPA
jgi:hypothetical protein